MVSIGYIEVGDILITVDLFSTKKTAMKPGTTVRLPPDSTPEEVKKAVYELISGNKWDSFMDKIDAEYSEEII